MNILTSQIVFKVNSYTNDNYLHSNTRPVCPQDCFLFTIYDSWSDGLFDCDNYNSGSYPVFFDNNLVHEGGGNDQFSEDSSILFGVGCPSQEPSTSVGSSSAPSSPSTPLPLYLPSYATYISMIPSIILTVLNVSSEEESM